MLLQIVFKEMILCQPYANLNEDTEKVLLPAIWLCLFKRFKTSVQ